MSYSSSGAHGSHVGAYSSSLRGVAPSQAGAEYSQVTMEDLRFLSAMEAEERQQAEREIAHLPSHLRPDAAASQQTNASFSQHQPHAQTSFHDASLHASHNPMQHGMGMRHALEHEESVFDAADVDSIMPSQASESNFGRLNDLSSSSALVNGAIRGRLSLIHI